MTFYSYSHHPECKLLPYTVHADDHIVKFCATEEEAAAEVLKQEVAEEQAETIRAAMRGR